MTSWLPDGFIQIFRLFVFGPSGLKDYDSATLQNLIPSLRQGGGRRSNFAIWQHWPGCDVEGDEDIDGVVLVGGEDEEDAEDVADPGEGVEEVDAARSVVRDEEVEQGQGDRVAAEHVVTAGSDSLETREGSVATPISECNFRPRLLNNRKLDHRQKIVAMPLS